MTIDWQKRKVKYQRAVAMLMSLGYHKSGFLLSTQVLVIKIFAILKIICGLPTPSKLGVSRTEVKNMDQKNFGRVFMKREPVEKGYIF